MGDAAQPRFGNPVGPWHWWFAWRPIKTYDRRTVWLRWVLRRCIQKHEYLTGGDDFWWQFTVARLSPKEPQ